VSWYTSTWWRKLLKLFVLIKTLICYLHCNYSTVSTCIYTHSRLHVGVFPFQEKLLYQNACDFLGLDTSRFNKQKWIFMVVNCDFLGLDTSRFNKQKWIFMVVNCDILRCLRYCGCGDYCSNWCHFNWISKLSIALF